MITRESREVNVPDIFKALKKIKINEPLPGGGLFEYFNEHSQYPGFSLFLRHKKEIKFFYIDHDDFLSEIKDQTPVWDISMDGVILRLSLIYKYNNADVPILFVFNSSKKEYAELLEIIRKDKRIDVYFLVMLYGGLVLDSIQKLKMPPHIVSVLKNLK